MAHGNTDELRRVVDLNEAAKVLFRRSFEINLRALDAIVQSKRSGGRLRGFDEVSSQIRLWSRELQEMVEQLGALGRVAVAQGSRLLRRRRAARLIGAAVAGHDAAWATASRALVDGHVADGETELRASWHRIIDKIDDLNRLGLMACVLSRSALIEATAAEAGEREALTSVSRDFYAKSQEIVDIVQTLAKSMRRRHS